MQDINVQKSSSSRFSFPRLPEDVVSPEEPVDVRVSERKQETFTVKLKSIIIIYDLFHVCCIDVACKR